MKNSVRMVVVLVAVGLVSGSVLVCVYNYASPIIKDNEEKALKEAIFRVLLEAETYQEITIEGVTVYKCLDRDGDNIGYAFTASGNGYQGKIELMAALDKDLRRMGGIEILESSETPGLGSEIGEPFFKAQFRGLSVMPRITFTKGPLSEDNQIQAITGATISTRAVVEILNRKIEKVRKALGR